MKLLNLFVASVFTISSLSLAEVQIGQQTLPAGSQSSSASTASASVSTSNTTTTVGGQVRLLGTLFNSDDQSKPENYPFSLDRTRLWIKREQNGVEGYVQLRFESNQNGKDNEGKEPSTSSFVDVNRAYVNFKSVADGLDLQLGKQVYKFADDTDYGLTKTDVYEFFGKPNTDYGLGLFADYRLPNSVGTAHVAITNGNSKSNEENNSQKAVVTYFSIFPLLLAGSDEQGLRTNFGYAANVLKKDGDKNVLDAVLSLGMTSSAKLTLVDLGVEYNLRKTTCAGRLVGDTSGSGLALRAGYKLEALSFTLIYSHLKKNFEDEQSKGFFGGKLDRASKQANGSSVLAVSEYKVGPSVLGVQFKLRNNDAKFFKNSAGQETNKSTDDFKLYAAVSF